MPVLTSGINTRAPVFRANAEAMQASLEELRKLIAKAELGGGDKARERHLQRGKLLPRQRIDLLLDPLRHEPAFQASMRSLKAQWEHFQSLV